MTHKTKTLIFTMFDYIFSSQGGTNLTWFGTVYLSAHSGLLQNQYLTTNNKEQRDRTRQTKRRISMQFSLVQSGKDLLVILFRKEI